MENLTAEDSMWLNGKYIRREGNIAVARINFEGFPKEVNVPYDVIRNAQLTEGDLFLCKGLVGKIRDVYLKNEKYFTPLEVKNLKSNPNLSDEDIKFISQTLSEKNI